MELVSGALPSVITKLGELLVGEYKLQKGVRGKIRFLKSELESMTGALEKVSNTPSDQLDIQDKIWARDLRELSYDIEDSIDTFVVCDDRADQVKLHGFKKFIDRSVGLFRRAKIRHGIAAEIRDIMIRVQDVAMRRERYKINSDVAKTVTIDPRVFAQYQKVTDLVGIDETRVEIIKILMEDTEVPTTQQDKIVSIVGFGGLGKTTLANVVYENLRVQFECSAFVSVSRTPDVEKLLKDLLYQLGKTCNASTSNVIIRDLREFLHGKRYFVVIDDVWDTSVWRMIRCALPDNNIGSKIITTTRIFNVAEQAGGIYHMKCLSLDNARKLLYRRIFGIENKANNEEIGKCPDEELAEVSDKILKKCAGVPLAIITIASLLGSKTRDKLDWYMVYKSMGTGLEKNFNVETMRNILLLSYYDLPSHLKACLLYVSLFPEDYWIEKDRLIWMWIAEGFIKCTEQGVSLLELGESCLNELINRSMIQPVPQDYEYCRVHDTVLDLMRALSRDENFVTVVDDDRHESYAQHDISSFRRLSIQNCKADHVVIDENISKEKIRSVVFSSEVPIKLDLGNFRVLRVLDLNGCHLSDNHSLKYLGKLIQLRYLGLRATGINYLPEEIGKLQFLLALDIRGNNIWNKTDISQLTSLRCLHVHGVPTNGISSLTSLEVLTGYCIEDSTSLIELGYLTELRVLDMRFSQTRSANANITEESLVECLHKLKKIQSMDFTDYRVYMVRPGAILNLDAWHAPAHLRRLFLNGFKFSARPDWMNPSHLLHLTFLLVRVEKLKQEDIRILGRLPALQDLTLKVDHEKLGIIRRLIVGASSFPSIVRCRLWGFLPPVEFGKGAMPRLTNIDFTFPVRKTRRIASLRSFAGTLSDIEVGLGNLRSLQNVALDFSSKGDREEDMFEALAMMRREAKALPNCPTFTAAFHRMRVV